MEVESGRDRLWHDVLPRVFEVLLSSCDRVVDDTVVERLLSWIDTLYCDPTQREILLKRSTGIMQFLSHVCDHRENNTACVFALRLVGILLRHGHDADDETRNLWTRLMNNSVELTDYWSDPAVRIAYFTALDMSLSYPGKYTWLQGDMMVQYGCKALDDTSMFVAKTATDFLVHYTVLNYDQSSDLSNENTKNPLMKSVIETLKSLITGRSKKVLGFIARLFEKSPVIGQNILHNTGMMESCFNSFIGGNTDQVQSLIDFISTMVDNTSNWCLDWSNLLVSCPAEHLLRMPVILYNRGLIHQASHLAASLCFPCQLPSQFPVNWFETLFHLVTAPVITMRESSRQACPENIPHLTMKQITSLTQHLKAETSDQSVQIQSKMQHVLIYWLQTKPSLTQTIVQSLMASEEFVRKSSRSVQLSSLWLEWMNTVIFLTGAVLGFHGDQLFFDVKGNIKLLKASISVLSVSCQLVILPDTEHIFWMNCCGVLLQTMNNTLLKPTVGVNALKLLGEILKIPLDCFSSEENVESTVEPSAKKPKTIASLQVLDISNHESKWSCLMSRVSQLLVQILTEDMWELKDSVLEMFYALSLDTTGIINLKILLKNAKLCEGVWASLDDEESYVRSSAIQFLGNVSCLKQLWDLLSHNCGVTKANFVEKILSTMRQEDLAVVRRSAVNVLSHWIKQKNSLAYELITAKDGNVLYSKQESTNDLSRDCTEDVFKGVVSSCQDLDWGVKLGAFAFWEEIIKLFSDLLQSSNLPVVGEVDDNQENQVIIKDCLSLLCDSGAITCLVEGVIDCDHLVCEKSLQVLQQLKHLVSDVNKHDDVACAETICTVEDFYTHSKRADKSDVNLLIRTISCTDFDSVLTNCTPADHQVRENPVSFLEDIITSAEPHDDNLLDCY